MLLIPAVTLRRISLDWVINKLGSGKSGVVTVLRGIAVLGSHFILLPFGSGEKTVVVLPLNHTPSFSKRNECYH